MNYKNILFDLDGTLIDSATGIEQSFNIAYRSIFQADCPVSIKHLIGPPINEVLYAVAGTIDPNTEKLFVKEFKQHYDTEGHKSSILYPGTLDFLEYLYLRGINLFIATNKRHRPASLIIAYFSLNKFFKAIHCPDSLEKKFNNKSELVNNLLYTFSLKNDETLFVGDTFHDGFAAEQNNLKFALVKYGYGDYPNPTYRVDKLKDLLNII